MILTLVALAAAEAFGFRGVGGQPRASLGKREADPTAVADADAIYLTVYADPDNPFLDSEYGGFWGERGSHGLIKRETEATADADPFLRYNLGGFGGWKKSVIKREAEAADQG